MSVRGRIIAGKYRHRPLKVLFNDVTRSTKERVKEAMFSALGEAVIAANVLDLFAGSGALGIEAISRGAHHAFFYENSRETYEVLKQNCAFVSAETTIIYGDYKTKISHLEPRSIDLVFIDPPYDIDPLTAINLLLSAQILKAKFIIVVESEGKFPHTISNTKTTYYEYGRTHVAIIRGGYE